MNIVSFENIEQSMEIENELHMSNLQQENDPFLQEFKNSD